MKSHTHFFFFLLFLLIGVCPVFPQEISFSKVLPPEGTSWGGLITGITQDPQGYLWFASLSGLYKYDGYHLTQYLHDPQNPNSLISNRVECVYADYQGIIWIGTHSGFDRFDPITSMFTHFTNKTTDSESLSDNIVFCISEDHEKTIWVGTHGGLNKLDKKNGKFTRYKYNANDSTSLSNDKVRVLYEDHQGTIWVGCGNPFYPESWEGAGGLNRFNRKTGKFKRYVNNPKDPHSLIDNHVRAIFEDSRGNFWIGTSGDGLHTMDRATGIFERHLYNPAHPEKLSRPPVKKINFADDHITFIREDAAGAIWIGSFLSGLNRYDPTTQKITHYESDRRGNRFADVKCWWSCKTREGVLWISTWEGNLYKIDPYQTNIPHHDIASSVLALHQNTSAILWVGTSQGLICSNHSKGTNKKFVHDSLNPASLSNDIVQAICEDRNGVLWIGTGAGGLNRFNQKTQTFVHYKNDPKDAHSINGGIIYALFEDHQGTLWIGGDQGLDRMNHNSETFVHYLANEKDSTSLSRNAVTCFEEDKTGNLWIGTWNGGGINRFNLQTGKFKHYLSSTNITCILQDSSGTVWVGTDAGLYYSKDLNNFSRFNLSQAEIQISKVAYILEDDQKNLWISSSKGIIKLNRNRNKINIYGKKNGVNAINYHAGCKGQKGVLFFGDPSGYYSLVPAQLTSNPNAPQIVFSGFHLQNKETKSQNVNQFRSSLIQSKEIMLDHNQNAFSLDFEGIHYSSPEDNRIIFTLENYDDIWRKAGSEHTAYYYNVPPGQYIFHVKAASSDGVWAEKSIKIIITPPWWRTWWFYALCILAVTASVYTLFRYRLNQKLKAFELRNTISRDLHDEVGSTLSSIGFLSSMSMDDVDNKVKAQSTLRSINESAHKMLDAMNDIIWNIQPQNDTLDNIIARMVSFASELLEAQKVTLYCNIADNVKHLRLALAVRHDFLLIYKEAVNNLAKYSAASEANINLEFHHPYLILTISDNGKGFDPQKIKNGNGLKNMQSRAKKIGAVYHLHTNTGKGTTITLQVKPT